MTSTFNAARLARLDARMTRWVEDGRYAGIEWALGDASGPVHTGRAGARSAAEPGAGMPAKPLYRIYSMTKPLVSLAAMQLVEECRLNLHDPVGAWLPEYANPEVLGPGGVVAPAQEEMTVQHLLSHMSGLSYGFLAGEVARRYVEAEKAAPKDLSLREFVKIFAGIPLSFEPGTDWQYSIATDLLGAIVEIAGDAPLQDQIRERITFPLGMDETGFMIPAGAGDRVMAIYGGAPGGLNELDLSRAYPHSNPGWARGGHGCFSTLEDYGKFCTAMLQLWRGEREGPVAPGTLQMMAADITPASAHPIGLLRPEGMRGPGLGGYGFGLGFRVCLPQQGWPRLRRILGMPGEFGWSGAAETWFTVAPEQGVWGLFMAQNLDWPGASADFQTMMAAALR